MTRCTWLKPCLWAAIVALLVCNLPAVGPSAAPAPAARPRRVRCGRRTISSKWPVGGRTGRRRSQRNQDRHRQ